MNRFMGRGGFALFLLLSITQVKEARAQISSNYDDFDVEKYSRLVQESERHKEHLARMVREANDRLQRARREAREFEERILSSRRQIQTLENDSAVRARDNQQLAVAINQTQNEIATLHQQRNGVVAEISALNSNIQSANAQLANLNRQIAQLEREAQTLPPPEAAAKRAEAQRLREQANQVSGGISSLQTQLRRKQDALTAYDASIRLDQGKINQMNATLASNNQRINQNNSSVAQLRGQLPSLEANLRRALDEVRAESQNLERVTREYEAHCQHHMHLMHRLKEVQDNLARGLQYAQDVGRNEGFQDGTLEGQTSGTTAGKADGQSVGARDGQAQGTAEGIARAEAAGRADGQQQGATNGAPRGQTDGTERGQDDGTAKGRSDGLEAGYQYGFQQGTEAGTRDGTKAGHEMGAYEKGHAQGYQTGTARAAEDARRVGGAAGTKKAEDEMYAVQLKQTMIVNHPVKPNGVSSARFEMRDVHDSPYYRPRQHFVYPAIQNTYLQAYHAGFIDGAARAYDIAYRQAYERAYQDAFRIYFDRYVNADYSRERKAAFDRAYSEAYNAAYSANYNHAYQIAYQPAYENAYNIAFPERQNEGRNVAYGPAFERAKQKAYDEDFSRGNNDGNREGYNDHYEKDLAVETKAAYDATMAYFASHAVLHGDGALVVDANEDGIFAPGETVSISIAVKNFGKVSQNEDLTVTLSEASSGLEVPTPRDVLAKIPAQTRALVTRVAGFRISETAEIGREQSIKATLVIGNKVLATQRLTFKVNYPYAVTATEFDPVVTPGIENGVSISIKNISAKASGTDVTVRLKSLNGKARVQKDAVVVSGGISAGETQKTSLSYVIDDSSAYQTLQFEITISHGNWILGRKSFSVDTSKRWVYNPSSIGLILVDSSQVGHVADEAAKLAELAFDSYDLQVEGNLGADVLLKYQKKAVVVPSLNSELATRITDSLVSHIKSGSPVLIGIKGKQAPREIENVIKELAGDVEATRFQNIQVIQSNFFKRNTAPVLVALAEDSTRTNVSGLSHNISSFIAITLSANDKITQFVSSMHSNREQLKQILRAAVLYDMHKEMIDDAEAGLESYSNNTGELRLTLLINSALGVTGIDQKNLAALYPDLVKMTDDAGDFMRRMRIRDVLIPLRVLYRKTQ